ncbi:Sec63 [Onygenales sp. PD_12]|nr:Sec63 [Onygenales sp. PD_12]
MNPTNPPRPRPTPRRTGSGAGTASFRRLLSTFKSPTSTSASNLKSTNTTAAAAAAAAAAPFSTASNNKPFTLPRVNPRWQTRSSGGLGSTDTDDVVDPAVAADYGGSRLGRRGRVRMRTGVSARAMGGEDGDGLGLERERERGVELPLDAFDRELLAQLEGEQEQGQNGRPAALIQRDDELSDLYGKTTPVPKTKANSRFFKSTTPFRGHGSSSSDVGPLSSPSLAVKAHRRPPLFSRNSANARDDPDHKQASLSSPQSISSSASQALSSASPVKSREIELNHAPPMIQGIRLVSTHELPDRLRSVFSFPVFNAIQSKSFPHIYQGDNNFVLSSPTGSGKTVIMELAICRLVTTIKDFQFKVVYQAPTKSLCSERFRDWQTKFSPLDLQCAELTGDTDHAQLRNVQNASIIITTPEKWDSMTRKWKDHSRLMQLVKLFLIDEVHILKEARGATLEAVVSRMKSVQSNVRFVALSATVPNSEDIAAWLGKDPTNQHLPAHRERFGEEFRPVKLQKFVYGYQSNANDFAFDKHCETKLPDIIERHSKKKPIMIFCCTRNSAIATSKNLAKLWASTNPSCRLWGSPTKPIGVQNPELKATISSGVAFHHAGLDADDRHAVESRFLAGQINVICCTSTLAVGVNLPCHLVIIKNTVSWQDNGCKEYADLEMMQMLGRAGRPQFDDSAVAVILTRKERVNHYEKLVAGTEPLESCLHLNLIDHLNAEIGLQTIYDVESAVKWLTGTFFFIRLRKNPSHYKLKEGADRADEEEMVRQICEKNIKLLQECCLVTSEGRLRSTEFGDAMARYYVKFETMRLLLSLPPKAKMSEILSAIAQADEFREIRLKAGEKSLYKEINKGNGIKFPIKIDLALPAHKISLLIQSELGAVEIPTGDQYQKHRLSFQQDKGLVFSHANRLIRCIIDCQISLQDSVSTRHALELARSIGARVWDNSALQMKQIDQIGIVAVRKLANAGINSVEALEATEPHRIDMLLSKNPPFGSKLLGKVAEFPKPRVSVKLMGKDIKHGKSVKIGFKAEIGFVNEKVPAYFRRRPVYVCFLAETSDGRMIDFRRISAMKLQNGHDILLTAELTDVYQYISCYVMCDDVAGSMRQAELRHDIPASQFPVKQAETADNLSPAKPVMNTSRRRSNDVPKKATVHKDIDEFGDDSLDDVDFLAAAEDMEYMSIDESDDSDPFQSVSTSRKITSGRPTLEASAGKAEEPVQLENGKWACNHRCKDKTRHMCCRDGTDKPPKASRKQEPTTTPNIPSKANGAAPAKSGGLTEWSKSGRPPLKTQNKAREERKDIECIDLCGNDRATRAAKRPKKDIGGSKQSRIEDSIGKSGASCKQQPEPTYSNPGSPVDQSFAELDWLERFSGAEEKESSSDYGTSWVDDLPSPGTLLRSSMRKVHHNDSNANFGVFEDDDDIQFQGLDGDNNEDDGTTAATTVSPAAVMKMDFRAFTTPSNQSCNANDSNNRPSSSTVKSLSMSGGCINPLLLSSTLTTNPTSTVETNRSSSSIAAASRDSKATHTTTFPLYDSNSIIVDEHSSGAIVFNDQNFFNHTTSNDDNNNGGPVKRPYYDDDDNDGDCAAIRMGNSYGDEEKENEHNTAPRKRRRHYYSSNLDNPERDAPLTAALFEFAGKDAMEAMGVGGSGLGVEKGRDREMEREKGKEKEKEKEGWEGIDPALMEEFADLVEFH